MTAFMTPAMAGAAEVAVGVTRDGKGPARQTHSEALRTKGDAVKVATAARPRRKTMTLKRISQLLQMGAGTHLKQRLYEMRRAEKGTTR